jgi:hypothetical protein
VPLDSTALGALRANGSKARADYPLAILSYNRTRGRLYRAIGRPRLLPDSHGIEARVVAGTGPLSAPVPR